MIRFIAAALSIAALTGAPTALGAANPMGTGQPSQSCEDVGTGPAGIVSTTNGFATTAVNVYANPTAQSGVAGNDHTVSQYDVACFQYSQHH